MTDDQAHELRILTERIADLRAQVAAFPASMALYVRTDLYEAREATRQARFDALVDRVGRMETADANRTTGNRTWLLNLAGTIVGIVVSGFITVLIARGGH